MKKILLTIFMVLWFTLTCYGGTNLIGRVYSANETINFNNVNLVDVFSLDKTFYPFEIKASWFNRNVELSYFYFSRRNFEGTSNKIFIFKDIRFEPKEKEEIFLSGAKTNHKLEAKLLSFSQYIAPLVRWDYIDYSMNVKGKFKEKDYDLSDKWINSSFGLGASIGYRKNKIFLEGEGVVYINRTGSEFNVKALWVEGNYNLGGGYGFKHIKFGPIETKTQGPFLQIGVNF
ncbi:MAG: hypothetical protein ACFFCZ_20215 [Promethearchaeota archaeon]